MPLRFAFRILKHGSRWTYRLVTFGVVTVGLLLAIAVLLLRYWLLPEIDDYRGYIVEGLSRAAKVRVQIGRIEGEWDGLRPRLILRDLALLDDQGRVQLRLGEVNSTLAWLSLFVGQLQFHSIRLQHLSIEVRRDADGQVLVAGIPIEQGGAGEGGLGDWLLKQHRIEITDSRLTWIDQARGAAPLRLDHVNLLIDQGFYRHRFGLRATPPADVAAPIDLRGDLRGFSFTEPSEWWGRLYLGVPYANFSGLAQWIELPARASGGSGSLRLWLTWERGQVRELTADVALQGVAARLADDLPEIKLVNLRTLLGWRDLPGRQDIWARGLTFATDDGSDFPPVDLSYIHTEAQEGRPGASEVRFNMLDLAAVAKLADRLPVAASWRERLAALDPHGRLYDFRLGWQDQLSSTGSYSARGSFREVAIRPSGSLPGFSHLSGTLDADEKRGTLSLQTADLSLNFPSVLAAPIKLDRLQGQLSWTMHEGLPTVSIEQLSAASADLVGEAAGRYQAVAGGPGVIDLQARVAYFSGRQAWQYIPLVVAQPVRDWFKTAILSGSARDLRVTLRGDLQQFPWAHGEDGRFEAVGTLKDGPLAYAPGWPHLEKVRAQLAVHGDRVEIHVDEGQVDGVKLSRLSAIIPALDKRDPVLQVNADATGAVDDFLQFIKDSPLQQRAGAFAGSVRAKGAGRLALRVELPLNDVADLRVNGAFQLANNTVDLGEGWPLLEDVTGSLGFSGDEVAIKGARARVSGAPVTFSAATVAGGGIRVQASGKFDAAALRRLFNRPFVGRLSGAADVRLNAMVRDRGSAFVLESDLVGLASTLPAPFAKGPQDRLPLRVERRERTREQDLIAFALDNVLSGQLLAERSGKRRVTRGEIVVGSAASAPQRDGIWVSGELERVDVDQWRRLIEEENAGASGGPILSGLHVSAHRVHAFSRDFPEMELTATRRYGVWAIQLDSDPVSGELRWQPEEQGTITGRFSKLQLPVPTPELEPSEGEVQSAKDLPSLDITAEDFRLGARQFGKLSLQAVPSGADWQIERLSLASPDGTFSINGLYRAWAPNPRTQLNVKLEVNNIGQFLARMNLPKGVDAGKAKLEGTVSWAGPPFALDLPTLSGGLVLSANNGRFVKIDPGIGKLLAVLSLQTLPKVATLDVRGIFSDGFAFDQISANVDIAHGVAHTQNFKMEGPAARVEMSGDVNLAAETQSLDVRVHPSLSESVALGAALVNPMVGLGALVVQKALKDPLGQILSFDYGVTGTWSDPTVTKKKREPAPAAPAGRR